MMIYLTLRVHSIETMQTGDINEVCDSIYFAGCSVACPFCFNKELWDANGGKEMSAREIVSSLTKGIEWVCLIGGEPLEQDRGQLMGLIYLLKNANKKVCLFTSVLDAWAWMHGRIRIDHIHIDLKLCMGPGIVVAQPYLNTHTISYGLVGYQYTEWYLKSAMRYLKEYPIYVKSNLLNLKQDGKCEYEILKRNGFLDLHMNEKINVSGK